MLPPGCRSGSKSPADRLGTRPCCASAMRTSRPRRGASAVHGFVPVIRRPMSIPALTRTSASRSTTRRVPWWKRWRSAPASRCRRLNSPCCSRPPLTHWNSSGASAATCPGPPGKRRHSGWRSCPERQIRCTRNTRIGAMARGAARTDSGASSRRVCRLPKAAAGALPGRRWAEHSSWRRRTCMLSVHACAGSMQPTQGRRRIYGVRRLRPRRAGESVDGEHRLVDVRAALRQRRRTPASCARFLAAGETSVHPTLGEATMRSRITPTQLLAVSTLTMLFALPAAAQQSYPTRPVRMIVPFPPGGSVDPLARLVAERMSEGLSQRFIVDNRAGGNTIIGTDALAKSKPDGYTVMVMSRTFVISSLLYPAPYDIIKDFAPVGSLTRSEWLLLVHPSLPVNNLREFIALAKARPGQLNYATNFGSALHLAGELLKSMAKIDMQIVNYKGGGPAFADLVGGHVELSLQPIVSAIPYLKAGRLRAIAITGDKRLPALPQVATFAESGLPGFLSNSWFGKRANNAHW
ncbi:MAG: hypothetical protein EHM59_18050 [Betaproteobacteria bacterium]|nr:MAG: hypothetical protein EHM59_18050 [Betaproteobacteria bacterium]